MKRLETNAQKYEAIEMQYRDFFAQHSSLGGMSAKPQDWQQERDDISMLSAELEDKFDAIMQHSPELIPDLVHTTPSDTEYAAHQKFMRLFHQQIYLSTTIKECAGHSQENYGVIYEATLATLTTSPHPQRQS